MTAFTIDVHEFYNELKEAGFTEKQADVIAKIQGKAASATVEQVKHDLHLDDIATKRDIEIVRREISDSKTETIKWVAAIVVGTGVAQIFAIIGVLKLLGKI